MHTNEKIINADVNGVSRYFIIAHVHQQSLSKLRITGLAVLYIGIYI